MLLNAPPNASGSTCHYVSSLRCSGLLENEYKRLMRRSFDANDILSSALNAPVLPRPIRQIMHWLTS